MKALIFILVIFVIGCNNDSEIAEYNLIISTVDINGDAYPLSEIVWWYESNPDIRYNLECDAEVCSTWEFPLEVEGSIFMRGSNTVLFENDPACWEVFDGESNLVVDANIEQKLDLNIIFNGSVCT
ncbi:hypothetical protein L3081_23135 [Colwellia sp. MSW7]|uniref:Uncharacterized protein n=1 Tax=Colwellia maritima TaxID=2912588 RepID=A0ABS9X677_9GAMM|nr:hypothetical protein [Colwellia maritima]MCI2285741.1 hypothetical protein [Colwellia maritima]